VGTDPTGKVAVPNQLGIHVEAGNTLTVLGGLFRGYGNVISGNNGDGVRLESTTIVRNNLIGTDRAGTVPVGNLGYGIESFADGTSVGGAGVGNVIANSQLDGVLVSGGIHNTISSNRIFDNRGLGIRLVNGGNMGVQPGSIFAQYTTAVTVRGQVAGLAGQSVRVELYADQAGQVDPSGQGEGALFVAGANAIKFDQFGNYSVTFKRLLPAGYNYVCITLTGPDGDTSAFSFVFQVR
jgi:parallel beta-helix repeat protein